ncbi:MAG: tripartite tricarboxylate transporter substrate binding protein [Burkholderiaceae bacterium]
MKFSMRKLLLGCLTGLLLSSAAAQEFPTKPVRLVVGFPPGGLADIMARTLADKLPALWNQPVLVDNRPGASGTIAADIVAKANPDGHTLLLILTNHVVIAAVRPKLPFDPLADFAPVSQVGSSPLILLANPKFAANTLPELIALAKTKPGVITYSTPGDGSVHHLQQELLNAAVGVKMIHVPYVGGAPAMLDAISGVVDLNVGSPAQGLQQVEAGKLKALSYTGSQRSALLPRVPTVAEAAVPGFSAALWGGVLAPGRTPKALVARLNTDIQKVMSLPEVREKMTKLGTDVVTSSPEEFDKFIRSELGKWSTVAKQAGVKGE